MACYFCGNDGPGINAPHWTGSEYVRIDVCRDEECRDKIARAPRQPRKPRQRVTLYGDYAQFALFNRVGVDGSTPKSRRLAREKQS